MTDEIEYVKAEVADIAATVQESSGNESLRFALIVYRDEGDEYVTRTTDFTSLDEFQDDLDRQSADGGGDYPEAMDAAMAAMSQLSWRDGNVARVAFLIADAPPHTENAGRFLSAVEDHRRAGVKIYPVAASGVAQEAEYLMRLAAQATLARYIFLTHDSGIGNPHEEPLIPCYHVQLLNDLLSRVLESELAGAWIQPEPDDIIRSVGDPAGWGLRPGRQDLSPVAGVARAGRALAPSRHGEAGRRGTVLSLHRLRSQGDAVLGAARDLAAPEPRRRPMTRYPRSSGERGAPRTKLRA